MRGCGGILLFFIEDSRMGIDKVVMLPLYIQIMLGCGYLGYLIARQGFRRNEQVADQVLGVIAFGLPALPAWFSVLDVTQSVMLAALGALVFCVLFALLWRVWLGDAWFAFTHDRQISNDDGRGNIWDTLIQDTQLYPTQITIYLKGGERLRCADTFEIKDTAINAPVLFDGAGNVAFFATEEWLEGQWKPIEEVQHAWGDRLTYIPAAEIVRADIRYMHTGKPAVSV